MPQSGYTPIQLYHSTTASAVPSASDLATGEIAVNLADEKLYFKNASGVVKLLASNAGASGSVTSVAASGGTTGLTVSGGPITSSGTLTLGGTLNVANGGTGATSLSSGYLLKGNGTSAVSASILYDTGSSIGIGTSTPAQRLDVFDGFIRVGGASQGRVFGYSSSNVHVMDLGVSTGTGSGSDLGLFNLLPGNLTFGTSSTERMRISNAGNVGIGTSAPAQRLDVYDGVIRVGGASQGKILGYNASNANIMELGVTTGTGSATDVGVFNIASGNVVFGTSSTERMRIDNAGNVGIGKNNPASLLDVNGTVTAAAFSGAGTGLTGTASSLTVGAAATANAVINAVTFAASGGTGPGTNFNGSVARTVDYSTVGAPKADGTGASGTWGINISGSAATATSATNAANLVTSNYSIVESGGYVYIKNGTTNICRIDRSGNAVFRGNVTGNDTSI